MFQGISTIGWNSTHDSNVSWYLHIDLREGKNNKQVFMYEGSGGEGNLVTLHVPRPKT